MMENNIEDKNGISIPLFSQLQEKLQYSAENVDIGKKNLEGINENNNENKNNIEDNNEAAVIEKNDSVLDGTCLSMSQNFLNTTEIDLSKKSLEAIDNINFPPNLRILNLSHNKLQEVPKNVLNLKDLQLLDISNNKIEYFNETPSFCHVIENLNVSSNDLKSPPLWIWLDSPRNLSKLNLSGNVQIADLLQEQINGLLQFPTQLTHVTLYNCRLGKYLRFLGTFPKAKELVLGTPDWSCYAANHLEELPNQGLNKCCDIQRLILPNTHIYTITPQISMFKNLIEINLSQNNLNGLPTEFCDLENLEICILSFNNISYVPDDIVKLKKLTTLKLAVNELCMITEKITELKNLEVLDLYDNKISEFPEGIRNIPQLDLAQNYFKEPDDDEYLAKRERLRVEISDRQTGRKLEIEERCSDHFPDTTDDEEFMKSINEVNCSDTEQRNAPPSSPEDWDSDSYWEPHSVEYKPPKGNPYWMSFVKKALDNGNLCPIDLHTVPVMEMIEYKRLCNPREDYESDGQFDDLSGEDC